MKVCDRGESWIPRTELQLKSRRPAFDYLEGSNRRIWVGGSKDDTIFYSDDEGKPWQNLVPDVAFSGIRALDFTTDDKGWAIVLKDEKTLLLQTTDGGLTWSSFEIESVKHSKQNQGYQNASLTVQGKVCICSAESGNTGAPAWAGIFCQ